jgi:predicted Zn-dependent protease
MQYLDQAIQNDPTNACDFNSVKGALLTEVKKYEEADVEFQKALAQDPNCERAMEALAVNYIIRAQDLKEETVSITDRKQQAENDKILVDLYQKSVPLLERYRDLLKTRNAEESEIKAALIKLQNAYYNLSNLGVDKSKELEEIEKVLDPK